LQSHLSQRELRIVKISMFGSGCASPVESGWFNNTRCAHRNNFFCSNRRRGRTSDYGARREQREYRCEQRWQSHIAGRACDPVGGGRSGMSARGDDVRATGSIGCPRTSFGCGEVGASSIYTSRDFHVIASDRSDRACLMRENTQNYQKPQKSGADEAQYQNSCRYRSSSHWCT
jgi:hypothetical protein